MASRLLPKLLFVVCFFFPSQVALPSPASGKKKGFGGPEVLGKATLSPLKHRCQADGSWSQTKPQVVTAPAGDESVQNHLLFLLHLFRKTQIATRSEGLSPPKALPAQGSFAAFPPRGFPKLALEAEPVGASGAGYQGETPPGAPRSTQDLQQAAGPLLEGTHTGDRALGTPPHGCQGCRAPLTKALPLLQPCRQSIPKLTQLLVASPATSPSIK